MKMLEYNEYIEACEHIRADGGFLKTVIRTKEYSHRAAVELGGREYAETGNDRDPYDFGTHVFMLPLSELMRHGTFRFSFQSFKMDPASAEDTNEAGSVVVPFDSGAIKSREELINEYSSGLKQKRAVSGETVAGGIRYGQYEYADKNGAPVMCYALFVDTGKARILTGTPDDGYKAGSCSQTAEGQALAAQKNGHYIVAAVNGDFYDMFGDFIPCGLCVKNGITIANADSGRPFFGILKNGEAVIADLINNPGYKDQLEQAVGGMQIFLSDGEPDDFAALEPFGYIRHPRTAVGLDGRGGVILLVVDGRIAEHSNGATLIDLCEIMRSLGAVKAINLDGGGSATFLLRSKGELKLLNRPADLFKPDHMLIREVYNTILVEAKI